MKIREHLLEVKTDDIYLYSHLSHDLCRELISDCWYNAQWRQTRKEAKRTGLVNPPGRPRLDGKKRRPTPEEHHVVAPYNPKVCDHYGIIMLALADSLNCSAGRASLV